MDWQAEARAEEATQQGPAIQALRNVPVQDATSTAPWMHCLPQKLPQKSVPRTCMVVPLPIRGHSRPYRRAFRTGSPADSSVSMSPPI